ncbi:MAG: PfkB family carbohydrate kinase [Thermoanaerobaculia bacterium]
MTDSVHGLARLTSLVDAFARRRVLVFGDVLADEFVYGRVARVSREAPVLILEHDATEVVAGGAGNAANNVAALGAKALAIGVVGNDDAGRRLVASLKPRVERRGIARARGYATPTKTRVLAGCVHSAKQQIVRIDRDTRLPVPEETRKTLERHLDRALATCDAVLVSDYGSGLVTPALVGGLVATLARLGRRLPVVVDSRYQLDRFRDLTACTPNESELEHVLGVTVGDDPEALERAGRTLLRRTRSEAVLVTRGSRGMALFERGKPTVHVPIFGSDEIADVTGAGDTVIATTTLALASGATFTEAARLANYAGGLVVMKRGTATVSADELRGAVRDDLGE